MASVQVTTGGHTNSIEQGSRVLVRTAAGVLYGCILDLTDNKIEMWKSSNHGVSWSEVAALTGNGVSEPLKAPSICIDQVGTIHMVFWANRIAGLLPTYPRGLCYVTFNPSTDTFGTVTQAKDINSAVLPTNYGTACAVNYGFLQVAYVDNVTIRVSQLDTVFYTYLDYINIPGGWSTKVNINQQAYFPDITIEKFNSSTQLPLIATINVSGNVDFFYGNTANASSFNAKTTIISKGNQTAGGYNQPQIVEDHAGNTYVTIAGLNTSPPSQSILQAKHNQADAYSTWQTPGAIENIYLYTQTSSASRGAKKGIRDKYFLGDGDFIGSTSILLTQDFHKFPTESYNQAISSFGGGDQPKFKWSSWHNHYGDSRLDLWYVSGGEVYYDYLDLNQQSFF